MADSQGELDLGGIFETEDTDDVPDEPVFSHRSYTRMKSNEKLDLRLIQQHPLWGHVLYPASIALARFIESQMDVRGKRCIEVGAGAGLPGIVCALEGSELAVLTDYPDESLLENLRFNAANASQTTHAVSAGVIVTGLVWSRRNAKALVSSTPTFDLLLMSDLVFNHSQHSSLLDAAEVLLGCEPVGAIPDRCSAASTNINDEVQATVDLSLSKTSPLCLCFYSHHRPKYIDADRAFLVMALERGWTVQKIVQDTQAGLAFPEDNGDYEIRGTVHGWAMRPMKPGQ